MIRHAALAVLFLAAWTPPAQADFSQEVQWCDFGGDHPDIRIIACTRNIQSGRFIGRNLAIAFANRGLAYKNKGQWDSATADFSEAIRLKPTDGRIYADRGLANEKKGAPTQALRDFKKAHALGYRHPLLSKKLREPGEFL